MFSKRRTGSVMLCFVTFGWLLCRALTFHFFCSLADFIYNGRIQKGGSIAQVSQIPFHDLPKDAPHDLPCACFWQSAYKLDLIRLGNGTDNAADGFVDILTREVKIVMLVFSDDKGVDALALNRMRIPN